MTFAFQLHPRCKDACLSKRRLIVTSANSRMVCWIDYAMMIITLLLLRIKVLGLCGLRHHLDISGMRWSILPTLRHSKSSRKCREDKTALPSSGISLSGPSSIARYWANKRWPSSGRSWTLSHHHIMAHLAPPSKMVWKKNYDDEAIMK